MIANELNIKSIRSLISGEVVAIHIERYVAPPICEMTERAIAFFCSQNNYTLTNDLQALGVSLGQAHKDKVSREKYFSESLNTIRLIREGIFCDRIAPIDKIRLEMDETWPHGCMVGRSPEGEIMMPGTIRRWSRGGKAHPHIDQKQIELLSHLGLQKRLGCNTYLAVPPVGSGGALEFWNLMPDEQTYHSMMRPDYGIDREKIGVPDIILHPKLGDMIIFDAARLHAVEEILAGTRITCACFLGYASNNAPLFQFA